MYVIRGLSSLIVLIHFHINTKCWPIIYFRSRIRGNEENTKPAIYYIIKVPNWQYVCSLRTECLSTQIRIQWRWHYIWGIEGEAVSILW